MLTEEEVHSLFSAVVSVEHIRDAMIAMEGFQRVDGHTASCKLRCGLAKDAHFVCVSVSPAII